MAYLFWAFAVVWIGIFLYLYGLVRRSRALEREVAELRGRARAGGPTGPARPGGDES
jgi:CcmD family protein